ncbi:MAG TPA: formyltransferase family protein [Steroidobacteraceae bacterium]|jgi:methionyl-tRNA formyltransferase|nr:formyltransferase family protein [Steroidobacteraceae bacterium]
MRFAITATDRWLGVLQALIERGWTPLKIFTTPVDGRLHHHAALLENARRLGLEAQISRLTSENLRQLADSGCETLVVASYAWRIPEWREHLRYAINFHPSPLPHGRGPYPLPAAILEQASHWGVSCHKLEHAFDAGDVLRTVEFPLSPDEEHDSLDLKVQLAARRLASDVAANFERYWNAAAAQSAGSYYAPWADDARRLDFSQGVAQVLRRLRAFGPLECLAEVGKLRLFVRRAVGWTEPHGLAAGTLVHANQLYMVVAASDGFIGLTEWSVLAPGSVLGTASRR